MEIQKVLKCYNFFTLTLPPTLAQPSHMKLCCPRPRMLSSRANWSSAGEKMTL